MSNIAAVLKDEILRLSRKEVRKQLQTLRKASAAYRREIAALKRQVQNLHRETSSIAKRTARAGDSAPAVETGKPLRFVAKGMRSLRARLGLSAADLARLMGVSDQSVYNWELKKTVPRRDQLAKLAALRALGKREAKERLSALTPATKRRAAPRRKK